MTTLDLARQKDETSEGQKTANKKKRKIRRAQMEIERYCLSDRFVIKQKRSLKRVLTVGLSNGRLEILTPGYKFPAITSFELFHNWFVGNKRRNVPSFKVLKCQHVKQMKGGAAQLRKMKLFMSKVERIACSEPSIVWPTRITEIKSEDLTKGDIISPKVYETYSKNGQARYSEISWKTMYNQMIRIRN